VNFAWERLCDGVHRCRLPFLDVTVGLVHGRAGTLLIDTGFPSDGTFASVPGDARKARDANRILAAARAAGVTRIDHLLITHFHADHDGAVPELAVAAV
jgi:glyoxylase-like metal-dependent hydrolase (beta-lactamase superfamily II)